MRALAELVMFLVVCGLLWFGCFYIAPAVIEAHPGRRRAIRPEVKKRPRHLRAGPALISGGLCGLVAR
jgi:hypothetical protein